MKNFFWVLFIVLFTTTLSAQAPKYKLLTSKDPLIGEWEWVKDPTGSPYSPILETDFIFIRFSPNDTLSVGAIENDADKGLTGHCYFLAYSNGATVFGTLSGCSNPANNGKTFRFIYEVIGDQLVIKVKGEQIYYKRKSQG